MRYAKIESCECVNGLDVGVSLFTQGCPLNCHGCHNSDIWDFDGGQPYLQETLNTITKLIEPEYIARFSVLGGEPLVEQNDDALLEIFKTIKEVKPTISIWLYTGYTYENLVRQKGDTKLQEILQNIDYLVDGPFVESQKDITLAFRGSRNQRILRREGSKFVDVTQSFDN